MDFERLNSMINEINNVIADVEAETAKRVRQTKEKDKEAFAKVYDALIPCVDVIDRASGRTGFKVMIPFVMADKKLSFGIRRNVKYRTYSELQIGLFINGYGSWYSMESSVTKNGETFWDWCVSHDGRSGDTWMEECRAFAEVGRRWEEFEPIVAQTVEDKVRFLLEARASEAHEDYERAQRGELVWERE